MKFILTPAQWILADLDPIEWRFLDSLPRIASGEEFSEDCRRRLMPDPIDVPAGKRDQYEEFLEDWNEFVRPDLSVAFSEARDQVSRDLALALAEEAGPEYDGEFEDEDEEADSDADGGEDELEFEFDDERIWVPSQIVIDRSSADAWYSTLNQARLLMNEAHDLAEATERFRWPKPGSRAEKALDGARVLLLAQYEFYTALQSILIETMLRPPDQAEQP